MSKEEAPDIMSQSQVCAIHRGLVGGYDSRLAPYFQLRQLDLPILCHWRASLPRCNPKRYPRGERFPFHSGKRGRYFQGATAFGAHGGRSSGGRSDGLHRSIPCAADGSLPTDQCSNPSPLIHAHRYHTTGYAHAYPEPTLPYAHSAAPPYPDPCGDTESQPYPFPFPSPTDLSQPSCTDHRAKARGSLGGGGGDMGDGRYRPISIL